MFEAKWALMSIRGSKMEKVNLSYFYQLGTRLSQLIKMMPTPQDRYEILSAARSVRFSVNALLEWGGGLSVCHFRGKALINALDDAIEWWDKANQADRIKDTSPIDEKIQNFISQAKTFETVLFDELVILSTYSVSKKGAYSAADLIDKAEIVFPNSVLKKLGAEIINEVREAGKCLAFDIPTASGFHMLRATEGILHEYYIAVCQPEKKDKLDTWGSYISALYKLTEDDSGTKKATKNHIKKVLALLQQVKDEDRNQIMHLEVVLSDDDAFILFEITKGAIMAMAEKLPVIQDKKPSTKST